MNMDTRGVVTLGKPADQIVDANSVNEICTKYSVMWRQIGLKLGLDASVLDNVEADYHEQRKRFEVTLRKWMKLAGDNATWDLLELAITNANREDLSLEALSELPRQPGMQTSASVQSKLGEQLQPSSGPIQPVVSTPIHGQQSHTDQENEQLEQHSANPLEFTADQEMFIAFEVLTETFLEEFRRYPSKKIADVSRWCSNYCRKFGIKNSFRVSSMDDVFQNIYDLPCHNFLNPGLLKFLASLSKNECLVKSVKNYESTFSPVKLKELTKSVGAMIQKIQVYKENEHCSELVTKLQKKDVTVGELHGFTAKLQNNILALHTGAILPQCIEEGCVCIRWIIPSCLVDYAYHSACLNTKMFSELNLLRVTIGRYTVEAPNDSVSNLNSHGFSVVQKVSKFVKPQLQDSSGTCLVEYDEKELEIFKISKNTRKQLLPSRCTIVEKFSPSNLILHYFDMIDTLTDCLQSVNHKKILKTLNSIMCSAIYGIKYFSADVIKRLQEYSNTTSLLRVLFTYTNWYDHSIIRELVKACDCPEGVKLLNEFDSRIDDTQPITAYPIPGPSDLMVPDVSSTHTVMGVWCEQLLSSLTLKHVGVVKSLMMNKISITKHACILLAVDDDKFAIFYWLIPRSIESLIRNAVEGLSSYLYENGLLEVVIYPNFSSFSTSKEVNSFQLIHRSDEISTKAAVSKAEKTIDMSLLSDTLPTVPKMPAATFPNRRGRRRWRPHLSQTAGVSKLPFLSGLMPFTDYTSSFDSSSTDDEVESIFKDRMVKSTTPLTALYSEVALQKSTDEHALLESGVTLVEGAVVIDQIKNKDDIPTMKDLNRYVVKRHAADWVDVCMELQLDIYTLSIVEKNDQRNESCFQEILHRWLRITPNATWKTLEIALTNVRRRQLGLDPVDDLYNNPGIKSYDTSVDNQSEIAGFKHTSDLSLDSQVKTTVNIGMLTKPKMENLVFVMVPKIKEHWEDVAHILQFKFTDVEAIKAQHNEDPRKCCWQLFQDWLWTDKGVHPKTWSTLLDKLEQVEELKAVMDEIKLFAVML
ncbi:uncharacterized protein [Dysidea avara]|uniref:uncharacterized protein isoform X2 n=1 Tax=Dysidea avara TaxID=196820 RepID=UPI003330D810